MSGVDRTIVLAFDTSTADTVVGLQLPGHEPRTVAHRPAPGERPGHSAQLLALAGGLLAEAGIGWPELTRIGVGTGPGTFTGLRIAVSTARALVQAGGQELVAVGSLDALLHVAAADLARERESEGTGLPILACGDARRGELSVAGRRHGSPLFDGPRTLAPDALIAELAAWPGPWRAVGDGAVRHRSALEAARVEIPEDASPLHRVDGVALCALARLASPVDAGSLEPEYARGPDAVPTHLR